MIFPARNFSPRRTIDFTHGKYICVDGLYHSYLMVPSQGFKSQVAAGWLSLLVNAGDGIDVDLFLSKQPKERMVQKLGQQLRINRSKIKDASDTNTDFDDLDGAIRSGYFLKNGLSNNEDFYYMNLLDYHYRLQYRGSGMARTGNEETFALPRYGRSHLLIPGRTGFLIGAAIGISGKAPRMPAPNGMY